MDTISRRRLLQSGLVAAATFTVGPAFWRNAMAAPPAQPGPGPYGDLLPADANGIMLPRGFTSRVIAQGGQPVGGTPYIFPPAPDGAAAFPTPDGGWILAVNTEVATTGGASAIRFDSSGAITQAYRILENTDVNCAGGATPWGTWLSCEEVPAGSVWECDPTGVKVAVEHKAMGVFQHEAACVDPVAQKVYLSEDRADGGLYRFTPAMYPDLSAGLLEIACGSGPGTIVWKAVPDPTVVNGVDTRLQVPDSIKFNRGEGISFHDGYVFLATTNDETIHQYDTRTSTIETLYRADLAQGTPLRGVDNVHASRSGDVFVAEDSYTNDPDAMDICIITPQRQVSRFLKLTGNGHFILNAQSETVGIAFDPSGTRMYVGSQRFNLTGIVYEISGPFRQTQPPAPPAPTPTPTPVPGVPIGLDIAKKISISALIRRGLAVAFTLDQASTVRVRITARVTQKGRRKTVTLATLTRKPGRGHTTLRVKPAKAMVKLLRARRRSLTANVEVRITTPGAPVRTFRRTVSLRP